MELRMGEGDQGTRGGKEEALPRKDTEEADAEDIFATEGHGKERKIRELSFLDLSSIASWR